MAEQRYFPLEMALRDTLIDSKKPWHFACQRSPICSLKPDAKCQNKTAKKDGMQNTTHKLVIELKYLEKLKNSEFLSLTHPVSL